LAARALVTALAVALPMNLWATEPAPESAKSSDALPLITPYNFDPADPGEYSRSGGHLSPGHVATGPVWNRPLPKLKRAAPASRILASIAKPAALINPSQSATKSDEPIEPILAPDLPVSAQVEIAATAITKVVRPGEVLPILGPQTRQLGKSVLGLPIVGHSFGTVGAKTLIFAAIHSDEPATAFVANQLVEHLTKNPEACYGRRVMVVPVANPDGLARGTRTNAREIDLNRNFPAKNFAVGKKGRYFGGEEPASEPESQVLIQLIDEWKPERIITLHAIARGKHGNNFDGPAERLAESMSFHNRYAVLSSIGYPTPGSFGSWSGIDRKLPTITLEIPSDASGAAAWRENREALLAVIQAK
jgi:protein MpaA